MFMHCKYIIWFIYHHNCRGLVPKRKGAHLTEVKGIFPGATVMRGKDWSLGNEDGKMFSHIHWIEFNYNPTLGGQGGLGKVVVISSSKDGKKLVWNKLI